MTILIIADHSNNELKDETLKTIGAAIELAGYSNAEIHALIIGNQLENIAQALSKIDGLAQVIVADNALYQHQLAENISELIVDTVKKSDVKYSHILTSTTTTSKNFLPRVAALLNVEQISDVIAIEATDIFKRPIYAGNAIATVQSSSDIKVLSIRTSAFNPANSSNNADILVLDSMIENNTSRFVSEELTKSERPELTSAEIIISGGRGMKSGENFKLLEAVADKLGAGIGASRAAVDAGFVPNDMQIGQTGKIVAPKLYIAVGISGAIQHLAGMKDSNIIVAINSDEEAPIFQIADYGLVGDLFQVLPELESLL